MYRTVSVIVPAIAALLWATVCRTAPPAGGEEAATAERAPPGGWKLADLTATMQTLRGRSYERGAQIFERAHCATCHPQPNARVEFAPDLTKLEPRFQPLDILRDILEPSRRIADAQFDVWIFETDGGQVAAGIIQQETREIVKVMEKPPAAGPPTVLRRTEIIERRPSLLSMMPQGLVNNLTRDEIADLVAYIAARGDPTDPLVQPPAAVPTTND